MAQLKRQEPVGIGLRRIACEAIEAGVRALTRPTEAELDALDAIREAAAVLALIGQALPQATQRRDRQLIQRIVTGLDAMDHHALLLSRLDLYFKKPPADAALAGAVKALRKQWPDQADHALSTGAGSFNPVIYRLVADMAELRGHVGNWPIDAIDNAPPRGLRRTYATAKRLALQPAQQDTLPALADEVALLTAQLNLLCKACPTMIKAHRKLLNRCAQSMRELIADHTLDRMLREQLREETGPTRLDATATHERFAELTADLHAAFAESVTAFATRFNVYWSTWRARP